MLEFHALKVLLHGILLHVYVTGFEKTQLSHTQYFMAAFLRPCVSLEWHFGTIEWSWLSCIGAWRAGQSTKGWSMSVIFNLECCEYMKGPVGPQTGPLAFNCLRIPFCMPILSSPPTHHPYYYHLKYYYRHEKSCSKQL